MFNILHSTSRFWMTFCSSPIKTTCYAKVAKVWSWWWIRSKQCRNSPITFVGMIEAIDSNPFGQHTSKTINIICFSGIVPNTCICMDLKYQYKMETVDNDLFYPIISFFLKVECPSDKINNFWRKNSHFVSDNSQLIRHVAKG